MANKVRDTIVGLAVVAAAVWWFVGRGESEGAAAKIASDAPLSPADLAARLGTIRNVTDVKPAAEAPNDAFSLSLKANSAFEAGMVAQNVLHSIHNHVGSTPYSGTRMTVVVPLQDKYGKVTDTPLLELDYSADDISKIVFANVTTFDILNLAKVTTLNPGAPGILSDECTDQGRLAKYSQPFCSALMGAGAP